METKTQPLSAREMHKIVWVGVGVLTLFFVTYPIAMWRVSQKEKFLGSHIKSLTVEGKNPADTPAKNVTTVANQSSEPASASIPKDRPVPALPSAAKPEVPAVDITKKTAEIIDRPQLDELALKVYDRINQTWKTSPTFTQNLVYRVSASQDGAIANFEPLNQPAKDFTQETPLPNLLKSAETTSSSATPFAKLTVVFAPSGVLEVNP
jgi:bicarbonate transport system ATP-binding protein